MTNDKQDDVEIDTDNPDDDSLESDVENEDSERESDSTYNDEKMVFILCDNNCRYSLCQSIATA